MRVALNEIIPYTAGGPAHRAVAYVRPDEPSIYTVFASRNGHHWSQDRTVALPFVTPERKIFAIPTTNPEPSVANAPGSKSLRETIAAGVLLLVTD